MRHQARQECAIQQHLTHPNIVKLWSYTENNEFITIFMEWCNDARFLEHRLTEQHKEIKDESELKDLVHQILVGVEYLHSLNVIHADLKPHNVLIHRPEDGGKPIVKLCDFGISLNFNPAENGGLRKALMKQRSGTAGYIAPEIKANNEMVGTEIDVWALGIIIYEMSVGYKPTQVKNYKYGSGPIPFRPRDWKHLSCQGETVQDLIQRCL